MNVQPEISILLEKCKKCATCVQICPLAVFELKDRTCNTEVLRADLCILCGQCVSMCSQSAIVHSGFTTDKFTPIIQETLPSYEQTLELFRGRRSVRAYKDKPVEKEIIEKIIDGAFLAPSAENYQSSDFLVIQDKATLDKITNITADYASSIVDSLRIKEQNNKLAEKESHAMKSIEWLLQKHKEGRDMFLFNAPTLLVFHSVTDVSYAEVSVNLMLQNAVMLSHSLGMGGFYTGYVVSCAQNDSRIADLLNIPEGHKVYGAITIGYSKFKYKNWISRKTPHVEWI